MSKRVYNSTVQYTYEIKYLKCISGILLQLRLKLKKSSFHYYCDLQLI